MHTLEYLLLLLSRRMEIETGRQDLADAAGSLASFSRSYVPEENEPEALLKMHEDWQRRFDALMRNSPVKGSTG